MFATVFSWLCGCTFSLAQGSSSFYFTEPQPHRGKMLYSIPSRFTGNYISSVDSSRHLHVTRDSVYLENPRPVFIRTADAAAKGYALMDTLIAVKGDTLPCWIHNDTAYFYLYITTRLAGFPEDRFYESGDQLLVSHAAGEELWETLLISFQGNSVEVAFFDHSEYEKELPKTKHVKQTTSGETITFMASFRKKEWKKMLNGEWFPSGTRYNRFN